MNAEDAFPDDEPILTRLVACDEALAAGMLPQGSASNETPAELQPRLEGDLACIQILRQVLPRRASMPVTTEDVPFQQLGRFLIQRRLGQGSFGIVLLATDPHLGREVALKVPRPEALWAGELRDRFLREARAAAGLDHPNLVPVFEAGAVGPICYIASAYCPGITLNDWIKERAELAPECLAAGLVATLADAVGHAHARGVIHRDLKPSNVLLQIKKHDPDGDPSTVKISGDDKETAGAEWDYVPRITDFGLAKFVADATAQPGAGDGAATHSGAVLGTPNYMAPEQASGLIREVGPAADLYALGAILYELLTGRPPFRGESLFDTLEQVRTREPLPPGRLRPKLSRDLETICLKCLQKEPHKRYESAMALADDLRRYLASEPIRARPIRAVERGLKWARRRPALATLLAVSVLGPSAFAAVVLAYDARLANSNSQLQHAVGDLQEALDAKEEQRQQSNKNLRLALLAIDDFSTKVSEIYATLSPDAQRENVRRRSLGTLPSLVKLFEELLNQPPPDPDLQHAYANAYLRLGKLAGNLGDYPKAIQAYGEAMKLADVLWHKHPNDSNYQLLRCDVLTGLAIVYQNLHRLEESESASQKALEIAKELTQENSIDERNRAALAQSLNNIALLYEESGHFDRAETALLEAQKVFAKLTGARPHFEVFHHSLAASHFNLGRAFARKNQSKLSLESYGKACKIWRELADDHPNKPEYHDCLARSLTALGIGYMQSGRSDEAMKFYEEARIIRVKLNAEHPKVLIHQANLAGLYCTLGEAHATFGRKKQAENAFTQAREIQEKLVKDYPEIVQYRVDLGNTYSGLGLMEFLQQNHASALDWFNRSVETLDAVRKQDQQYWSARQSLQVASWRRVQTLMRLGRYAEVLRELDRSLELNDGEKNDAWRLDRAYALAQTGRHAPAMTEVDVLAGRQPLPSQVLYNLGCICSLCSAAVRQDTQLNKAEQDRRTKRYADHAVELLSKARAAGFFQSAAAREDVQKNKDLDGLRGRQDFQAFMVSLPSGTTP